MASTDFMRVWAPALYQGSLAPSLTSSIQMSTSTSRLAFVGRVDGNFTGTKDITKVRFRSGGVTFAGGSVVKLALQDVDMTAGQPMKPDGTDDETVSLGSPAGTSWITSAALSSSRTVSKGSYIAVVMYFSSYAGADSFSVQGIATVTANYPGVTNSHSILTSTNGGTTWSPDTSGINMLFDFTDGTFGWLDLMNSNPATTSFSSKTFNINTGSGDEVAGVYIPTVTHDVDAIAAPLLLSAGTANFDYVIYDSSGTALRTISVDANATMTTSSTRYIPVPFDRITLTAGQRYYPSIKATSTSNITAYTQSVSTSAEQAATLPGANFGYISRIDGAAWGTSGSTTEQLIISLRVCGIDAGGAGGLAANPVGGFIS